MAKWIFALLVFLNAGAQASGLANHWSGCVVLNEIIYEEVTASGWGMTGADLVFTNFREPSAVICTGTMQASGNAATGPSKSRRTKVDRGILSEQERSRQ